jgi:hypothetical protein
MTLVNEDLLLPQNWPTILFVEIFQRRWTYKKPKVLFGPSVNAMEPLKSQGYPTADVIPCTSPR